MSAKIPYVDSPGTLTKILNKIKEAGTPDNFNPDFLATKLGFKGGSARTFISWAKKNKFLTSEGTPTILYKKFRNPSTSGASMAEALKAGYSELYARNEYCHELDKKEFKGLVMEATGEPHDSRVVELIVGTFFQAKSFADFDTKLKEIENDITENQNGAPSAIQTSTSTSDKKVKLGLNYTINLVLPKTDDPAIYNAIFKSLRENLIID